MCFTFICWGVTIGGIILTPMALEKARGTDPFGQNKIDPCRDFGRGFFVVLSLLVLARRGSISKTTNMIAKLKNILRCYAVGMGIKERANTFHLSRNTVRKYVRLFISSGKTTEQLLGLSDARSSVTASRRNASWNWTR